MRTMSRFATRLFLGLIVAGATACGGGGDATAPSPAPGPGDGQVSGVYTLSAVRTLGNLQGGGTGIPVTFTDGSGRPLVFEGGTLTLGADGAFALAVQAKFNGSPVEMTDHGTYTVSGGSTIDFNSEKSSPRLSTGSLSGNQVKAFSQFGGIPFEITTVK
jgi:hypothetical protein